MHIKQGVHCKLLKKRKIWKILKNEKERKRDKEKEKWYSQKFVKKSVQQVFFRGKEGYIKSSWKMTLVDYNI